MAAKAPPYKCFGPGRTACDRESSSGPCDCNGHNGFSKGMLNGATSFPNRNHVLPCFLSLVQLAPLPHIVILLSLVVLLRSPKRAHYVNVTLHRMLKPEVTKPTVRCHLSWVMGPHIAHRITCNAANIQTRTVLYAKYQHVTRTCIAYSDLKTLTEDFVGTMFGVVFLPGHNH